MAQKKSSSRKRSRPVSEKKSTPNKNLMILAGLAVIIVIAVAAVLLLSNGDDQTDTNEPDGNPIAIIDTSKGTIKLELYADQAPYTVENFVKLANDGFYDGTIFHRISNDFMIQAGRELQDGTPKNSPYGNIEQFEGDVHHADGTISMASTGAGVPGSSQFFICDGDQSFLDGSYAAFGVVTSGIEVVRDIADDEHDGSFEPNPGGGKPLEDIVINSITIEQ